MATDSLDGALETLKIGKAAREQLVEAAKSDWAKARQGIRGRYERVKASGMEVSKTSLASAVGGGIAEPVRRNLIGRLTKDIRAQGIGLLGAGFAVSWLGSGAGIPYVREIGQGHAAVAGWMLAVSMYGDEKKPDPVKVALEETTYKAKHPKADKSDK